MNLKTCTLATLFGGLAVTAGYWNSDAVASRGTSGETFPDVIVGSLPTVQKYGTSGDISAYSVATTSCNQGNDYLLWITSDNRHPTIGQNMYRVIELPDGGTRVEHIGMSWLKHGFCALQQTLCGSCSNPAAGGCADRLGWNCSDPYSSGLNGQQSNLGPRFEVNPSTGYFPFPFSSPGYPAVIGRRLNVPTADLDPSSYPDSTTTYFVEGMYVHPDDAAACMAFNNASYREVTRSGTAAGGYDINVTSTTRQMLPGIFAWQEIDPDVTITEHQISDCSVSGLNETFFVGSKAWELGNGMWHYEYAIYNLDCTDAIQKFEVPFSGSYTNTEQSFAMYHSGEPYSNAPWAISSELANSGILSWSCKPFTTDPNSNAIRWNTMHTFSFETDSAPIPGSATIGLFESGSELSIDILVPETEQLMQLSEVGSVPEFVSPSGPTLSVQITEVEANGYEDGSAQVVYDTGSGQQSLALTPQGGDIYSATLPALPCGAELAWFFTANDSAGATKNLPTAGTFTAIVADGIDQIADADFNTSEGWTVSTTATAGGWERAIPSTDSTSVDTCSAPGSDADESGFCWVTGNGVSASACANDIDGGSTILTSSVYAVDSPDTELSFAWWYDNTSASNTEYDDVFVIEISGDSGSSWTELASISNGNSAQTGWTTSTWRVGDYVTVTSGLRIRCTASDNDPGSVVEAGIDAFKLVALSCDGGSPECPADIDGDNEVGGTDLTAVLASWGASGSEASGDLNGDQEVNGLDLAIVLANWGSCPN